MRTLNDGRVSLSSGDLDRFRRAWPSSGLDGLTGVTFEYDQSGLVGITFQQGDVEEWDGPALAALSHDALDWSVASGYTDERRQMREKYRRSQYPWWWPDSWAR